MNIYVCLSKDFCLQQPKHISFIFDVYIESEFIVKNEFHNWTSELGCIWHVFGKLDYFCLFLSAPVQAASGYMPPQFFKNWLLPVLKCLKGAKNSLVFQKCVKCTLTLMSNLPSLSLALFFFNHIEHNSKPTVF